MLISRKRALTIAALGVIAIALLAGGASNCPSDSGSTGSSTAGQGGPPANAIPKPFKKCDTKITQQPRFSPTLNSMVASTKSFCDKLPLHHLVTITMWYHPYMTDQMIKEPAYIAMGNSINPAIGLNGDPHCGFAPYPHHDTTCHLGIPGICHVGMWKITVLVTGEMDNATFSFPLSDLEEKPQSVAHCTPSHRG